MKNRYLLNLIKDLLFSDGKKILFQIFHINVPNYRVHTVCACKLCLSNFWRIEAQPGVIKYSKTPSLALLSLNGHADFVTSVNEISRSSTAEALHAIGRAPLDTLRRLTFLFRYGHQGRITCSKWYFLPSICYHFHTVNSVEVLNHTIDQMIGTIHHNRLCVNSMGICVVINRRLTNMA